MKIATTCLCLYRSLSQFIQSQVLEQLISFFSFGLRALFIDLHCTDVYSVAVNVCKCVFVLSVKLEFYMSVGMS